MPKTLITYYSRTGVTKKLAEIIANRLGADLEEIKDTVNRSGAMGYLAAGRDASLKKLTKLETTTKSPVDYDLVIIGTPIWSWNLSAPIRTYAEEHKQEFKQVAFFCTMGGSGDERAQKDLEKIVGREIFASLSLTTKEVVQDQFAEKVENFISAIIK